MHSAEKGCLRPPGLRRIRRRGFVFPIIRPETEMKLKAFLGRSLNLVKTMSISSAIVLHSADASFIIMPPVRQVRKTATGTKRRIYK